jgi:hypothetical protein
VSVTYCPREMRVLTTRKPGRMKERMHTARKIRANS